MLQTIDGKLVYVLDLKTMPELPITGRTETEGLYAEALTAAIEMRAITEPGKYGLEVNRITRSWNVYKIVE